jgi:uncharacterized lipoprotein YddW (UPF0748 family)
VLLSFAAPVVLMLRPQIAPTAEFRGAWVATVDNIDWPSRKALPMKQAREDLRDLVQAAADAHLNALLFQVRPMADALYRSPFEPWSEFLTGSQGLSPDEEWDPLAFAVSESHANRMELHAWFNPFRAWHSAAKSAPSAKSVVVRHPEFVRQYGKQKWLDPGDPRAQDYTIRVILDVVKRYDIDGVHIDDYFYPYPLKGQPFPDSSTYAKYGKGQSRQAWRRANVDRFVKRLYTEVHRAKPWVKVGISPFGIYRPNVPAGIKASIDQYADLYADPRKWLQLGWCDYMTPQIYWGTDSTGQNFSRILEWWAAQNILGRHIWPGLAAYKMLEGPKWEPDQIAEQIFVSRQTSGVTGQIFFSAKHIVKNVKGLSTILREEFARPTQVPATPWLKSRPRI